MVNVSFKVEYKCPYGQALALVGDQTPLGHWSPKRGQRMYWSRGDVWTCNVMLPAGSAVECKYVILDEQGLEQRWQEGSNMVVKIPATCQQGLPVQGYDIGVSWCKTHASYRAHPLTTPAAAAAAVSEGIISQSASATTLPAIATAATAAGCGAATAATATSTAVVASAPGAATAAPVMAWALSKGASAAPEPARRLNPAAIAHAAVEALSSHRQLAPAAAGATANAAVPAVAVAAPTAPAVRVSKVLSSSPPPPPQADLLLKTVPLAVVEATAGSSKVATLVQAAATAVHEASKAAAAAVQPPPQQLLPAFQLSPEAGGGDGPTAMSIVLPSRSTSPPIKISLSSSFSKLMEMPALSRGSSGGAGSAGGAAGSAGAIPSSSSSTASAATASVSLKTAQSGIQSHPIVVDTAAHHVSQASSGISPVLGAAPVPAQPAAAASQPPAPAAAQSQPASSAAIAAAGDVPRHSQSRGDSRRPHAARMTPYTPMWGMEYDVYAAAYGIPYMHTPFDLEAYALYDHVGQEPASSPSPSSSSVSSPAMTHGSVSFLSESPAHCMDPLESAVQTAHCSFASAAATPATAAATAPAAATVNAAIPATAPAASSLLSADLWSATAASTALALGGAAAATTTAAAETIVTAAAATTAPQPATTSTAVAAAAGPAALPSDSAAAAAATRDVYRQVSRSSTSVSDWAGRTLFEMGSGRTLLDDDSDEDETADDEAAVAQALSTPTAPADMAALLTQLGTALGRSVRLRYDGLDATAQDLLELDRKIALAASKLYRQRDNLLAGWVRKETRRQLATAAAPAARPPMPGSNTVTPL